MSYLLTSTGKSFDFAAPTPDMIDPVDIAHALSHLCRYGGHVARFYSVAEHSVLVSNFCTLETSAWGLLHDASEAYLVDVPRPVKTLLPEYKALESRIMRAICERFGLPVEMPDEVHEIDDRIIVDESRVLMKRTIAPKNGEMMLPIHASIVGVTPTLAREMWLRRFYVLGLT